MKPPGGRGALGAAFKGNWKAVQNNVIKNPNAPVELYDLSKDIGEQYNMADAHPGLVAEMAARMTAAHTDLPS